MGRHTASLALLDEGDVEIFHPTCRTRIMVTLMENRRRSEDGASHLYVEGICPTCNKYVYLSLRNDRMKLGAAS